MIGLSTFAANGDFLDSVAVDCSILPESGP